MKSLKLNGIVSLVNRLVTIFCGFIIPRLIIRQYGSEVNGLISSISQYLSLITLLDLGMGSIIQSHLYQPLVEKDYVKLSAIYAASQRFFRKIGVVLIAYVIVLCFVLPELYHLGVSKQEIVLLILVLSASYFCQFLIGISSQMILMADQKGYIRELLTIVPSLLNLTFTYVFIQSNQSIVFVKFMAALVFIIPPILITWYVHKTYDISKVSDQSFKFTQQIEGIGQHLAYTVQESTDIVVLSLFSTLQNVSIYAVYNLIFQGIKTLIEAVTSGFRSYFGVQLYTCDRKQLQQQFESLSGLLHAFVAVAFGTGLHLISPFVRLFMSRSSDINYNVPLFGYVMGIALFLYCLRLPYRNLVFSAGEFKRTQFGAYSEAIINIVISIILVQQYGLIGVAIGTLMSMLFSLLYYLTFIYQKMFNVPMIHGMRRLTAPVLVFLISSALLKVLSLQIQSAVHFILVALVNNIVSILCAIVVYFIIDKTTFQKMWRVSLKK